MRLLIFWPAVIGTAVNADEASKAARKRQAHVATLMQRKGCGGSAPQIQTIHVQPGQVLVQPMHPGQPYVVQQPVQAVQPTPPYIIQQPVQVTPQR